MAAVTALIFAKYPTPGLVKTRLVPPLTPTQAAQLHQACLLTVCENLGRMKGVDTRLVVTPDDRLEDMRHIVGPRVGGYWPQGAGDLGVRLVRAAERAFSEGASGVFLLGADSPTLPESRLRQAMQALHHQDMVLGPCVDGGYYLLGLRSLLPTLFEGIDWGSERVTEQTRQRAAKAGLDCLLLPVWYDLDRVEDLSRAARDLAAMAVDQSSFPEKRALLQLVTVLSRQTEDSMNPTQHSVEHFLDAVAAKTPTPGGGGVAAAAAALAAAMARMVAAYSISKKTSHGQGRKVEELAGRLRTTDLLLRALILEDGLAYQRMAAMRKKVGEDSTSRVRYEEAILSAIAVPMEMAALCADALEVMDELSLIANRFLLSDLGVAAVLADAAARAARYSVRVNAAELSDSAQRDRLLADVDTVIQHAATKRFEIEALVQNHFKEKLAH